MEIKYLGHASFFIKTKTGRLVTDPFDPKIGLHFPKTEADIVTISHHHFDHEKANQVAGNPLVIDMPGEFEKNGIRVFGYSSYHDAKKGAERGEMTLYRIEAEGIALLHCGDLGVIPDQTLIDAIGEIDILFIPVGGKSTIDANSAVELVKELEPAIIIPMHFRTAKHDQKMFADFAPVDDFLKKIGADNTVPLPKLSIKKEDLGEEMKVIVLDT